MDWPKLISDIKVETGLSGAELARKLEVRPQLISEIETGRSKNPGSDFLLKLINQIGLNPGYLAGEPTLMQRARQMGNGFPFEPSGTPPAPEPDGDGADSAPVVNLDRRGVPFYDIEASAHIAEVLDGGDRPPEFYVDFQPFNDCSAYLTVYGDSMYPAIQSGEVIAVKEVKNLAVLLWGEKYLVITDEEANSLRTVKLVHQHEDEAKVILRASNPNFKGDTVIPKASILKMYLVKGKISRGHL